MTWRQDLDRVLDWTKADERVIERIGAHLNEDRRALLRALVESRGEVRTVVHRIGPSVLERMKARAPEAAQVRVERARNILAAPLAATWSPPPNLTAEQVAQAFLDRYGARLEELTGRVTKAVAAAKGASAAMQTVGASKELMNAIASVETQLAELKAVQAACAHPEGASLADRAGSIMHEGIDAVESMRSLRATASTLRSRCDQLATALQAWVDAPVEDRAATAGSMSVHLRAAALVVRDMRDQVVSR